MQTPTTGSAPLDAASASEKLASPPVRSRKSAGGSNLDRRRGPGIRRTDSRRAAEDGHMNEEQLDFIKAIDEYKRVNARPFPSWTEVLDVLMYLGYRRVAPVGEFKLTKGRQTPRPDDDDEC